MPCLSWEQSHRSTRIRDREGRVQNARLRLQSYFLQEHQRRCCQPCDTNTGPATVKFKLEDANGQLIFQEGPTDLSNVASLEAAEGDTEDSESTFFCCSYRHEASNMKRKLLKGGRGSTGGGRTRTGAGGRYGSNARVSPTAYGTNSCCIVAGTYIFVWRSGPRTSTGTYDSEDKHNVLPHSVVY